MRLPIKKSRIFRQTQGILYIAKFSHKMNFSQAYFFNRVYSSVGRMFVLSSLPDVHSELLSKQHKCDDILKSLDEKRDFFLKCSKDQEDNLRELVQQRKEASSN